MKPLPRLYAIADATFGDPVQLAQKLFDGGARLVQVRNKKASPREFLQQVERIVTLAPDGTDVIVNDRLDVALIAGAAGVHLGQTDVPVPEAHRILGLNRIIGLSTHNLEQALEADKLPVSYVAVGPIFPTGTKENPDPVVGIENLAKICRAIKKPVIAIGGIRFENGEDVYKAGVAGIAVISDLLSVPSEIESRVRRWMMS